MVYIILNIFKINVIGGQERDTNRVPDPNPLNPGKGAQLLCQPL